MTLKRIAAAAITPKIGESRVASTRRCATAGHGRSAGVFEIPLDGVTIVLAGTTKKTTIFGTPALNYLRPADAIRRGWITRPNLRSIKAGITFCCTAQAWVSTCSQAPNNTRRCERRPDESDTPVHLLKNDVVNSQDPDLFRIRRSDL